MKIIEISGTDFFNEDEFHEVIKSKLQLPGYYGKNLDALWDCFLDEDIDTAVELHWKNIEASKKHLGNYCNKIIEVFEEAEKELSDFKFIPE